MRLRVITALTVAGVMLSATVTATAQSSATGLQGVDTHLPANPVVVPAAVAHEGAPTPSAFTPEQIARVYASDFPSKGPFYFDAINSYDGVRQNHPEVMTRNLDLTVEINNASASDPARVERALADDHDDLMLTMSDAWGEKLGQHFRDAVADNRLPKTTQLLSGSLGRGGWLASTTFPEKYYYGEDRPFVVDPARIQRFHREGAEDEYSTSPSFPSGHTNQATWKSTMMAAMLPELGTQMLARGSEVGYNRVVLGVHYPLDVIGGRQTGTAAAIDRMTDPEFVALLNEASAELRVELEWRCGAALADCIAQDTGYLSTQDAVDVYTERMTYGFDQIGPSGQPMDVPSYSEVLLQTRFPELTWQQRKAVMHLSAIDSGYPLDEGTHSFNRLNLAAAWASTPQVAADGGVSLRR